MPYSNNNQHQYVVSARNDPREKPKEKSDGVGRIAYVATGEVTTLEHELGDDAVEGRALVAEAVLASAELNEVPGGLGDNVVVELEVDAAALLCREKGQLVF